MYESFTQSVTKCLRAACLAENSSKHHTHAHVFPCNQHLSEYVFVAGTCWQMSSVSQSHLQPYCMSMLNIVWVTQHPTHRRSDENRQVVVREALLVQQQLNHR